jgi:hypothetical protein
MAKDVNCQPIIYLFCDKQHLVAIRYLLQDSPILYTVHLAFLAKFRQSIYYVASSTFNSIVVPLFGSASVDSHYQSSIIAVYRFCDSIYYSMYSP